MIIRFANDFKIKLNNTPKEIREYLAGEIDEHVFPDDVSKEADITVEFKDLIEFDDEIKYVTLGAGFSEQSFYLFDGMHNKIRMDSFRDKDTALVEKRFNPKAFFEILEYLYMNKILEKNMMFLHSSGVTLEGKTVVFPASAGTGKTKMLIQMLKEYKANLLGDDWTIIDNKGNVYPYLRKIRLWANDILKQRDIFKKNKLIIPWLIDDHFDLSKKDNKLLKFVKRVYSLYLNRKLPIKLGATEINKDNITDYDYHSEIDYVIFLSRSNTTRINHGLIDTSILTERIICATLIENGLKPDYENWAAFANQVDLDSRNVQIQKMRSIMSSCFQGTKNIWLKVPLKASPDEIVTYVAKKIIY